MQAKGWDRLPDRAAPRFLVLGRSGQLAEALAQTARPGIEIVCLGRPELDITDEESIVAAIDRHAPDAVINAAAFTAVDRAETCLEEAMATNCIGAGNAASAAHGAGLPIIHVSTDYVYDGRKTTPYLETHVCRPLNVYGRTKLAGEIEVAARNPAHTIVRTGWLYAPWGSNFARTMLRLAGERESVRVVDDQFGTPTYVPHLADAILDIALAGLAAEAAPRPRIVHVAAAGRASWADFAERIFRVSGSLGGPTAEVERIETAAYPTAARRPANSVLSTDRLATAYGITLPHWHTGVDEFVNQTLAGRVESGRLCDHAGSAVS